MTVREPRLTRRGIAAAVLAALTCLCAGVARADSPAPAAAASAPAEARAAGAPTQPPIAGATGAAPETDLRSGLPPSLSLQPGWYARIETSKGLILARLLPEQAPQSVAHFAALAEGRLPWVDPFTGETRQARYYDGTAVHLVEAGQRFEAGDRTGTGRGAPTFYVPLEGTGPISFDRPGRLGMTRAPLGRVSAVQFFVTASPAPWLKAQHPCFGDVIWGLDVIQAITAVKTGPWNKPIDPILLTRIGIYRVGDVEALPAPVRYHPKPPVFGPKEPAAK